MKKILFTVGSNPIGADELGRIRRRLNWRKTFAGWLFLPCLFGSGYAGVLAYRASFIYMPEADGLDLIINSAIAAFTGFVCFVVCFSIFKLWDLHTLENLDALKDIDPSQADEALTLTARYSELDKWREAIVRERFIVQGELKAMQNYNLAALEAERQAASAVRQEAAFKKLHQY